MCLRNINDGGTEFRYEIEDWYTIPVLLENGFCTQCFPAYKYYKNNSGEWEMCKANNKVYIPLKTLMSKFVMIDSDIDKTLIALQDFKRNTQAKNLEASLKPFVFSATEENIDSCIKAEKDGND